MLSSAAQSHQQRKNVDLAAAAVAIGWWLMRNTTLRRRETVFSQTKDDESSQQSSRSSERPISPTPLCSTSLASAALFLYVLQHAVRISTYLPTYLPITAYYILFVVHSYSAWCRALYCWQCSGLFYWLKAVAVLLRSVFSSSMSVKYYTKMILMNCSALE